MALGIKDLEVLKLILIIIASVTLMGIFSILAGVILVSRGHESGEILIQGGGVAVISGLMGILGSLIGRWYSEDKDK